MPSLWLVDGSHTIFRATTPPPPLDASGVPTNAVYGFTTMLLRAIREGSPPTSRSPSTRKPRRSAARSTTATRPPAALSRRSDAAVRWCGRCWRRCGSRDRVSRYEADDVIATLPSAPGAGLGRVIVSGDKDMMQLVVDGIRCYDSMYEKWYGPPRSRRNGAFRPPSGRPARAHRRQDRQHPRGAGVGEKTAAGLLKEHGTLENVLANATHVRSELRENLLATSTTCAAAGSSSRSTTTCPCRAARGPRAEADRRAARPAALTQLEFVRLVNDLPRPPPPAERSALDRDHRGGGAAGGRQGAGRGGFAILTLTSEDEPRATSCSARHLASRGVVYIPLGHRRPAPAVPAPSSRRRRSTPGRRSPCSSRCSRTQASSRTGTI